MYQHPERIQPGRNPSLLLDFGVEVQLVSKITVFQQQMLLELT